MQFWPTRSAAEGIDIAGTTIPKGAPIYLAYGSANRDPEQFTEPDELDLERRDNQHLGFSPGIHFCFGAPLARLEVQNAVGEFVRRVENTSWSTSTASATGPIRRGVPAGRDPSAGRRGGRTVQARARARPHAVEPGTVRAPPAVTVEQHHTAASRAVGPRPGGPLRSSGPCAAPGYGGSGGVHTGPPSRPSPYTPYTPKSAVMPARPEA